MFLLNEVRLLATLSRAATVFAALLCLSGASGITLAWQNVLDAEERRVAAIDDAEQRLRDLGYSTRYLDAQRRYEPTLPELLLMDVGAQLVGGAPTSPDKGWLPHATKLAAGLFLVSLAGLVASGLLAVWRASRNLVLVGITLRYSPLRAVVSFLIPLLNLVLPPDALKEIHNRSRGCLPERAHAPNDEVTAWFASYIIGTVILYLVGAKFFLDAASNVIIMTPWWMDALMLSFATLLLLLSAWLFARLLATIGAAQQDLFAEWDDAAAAPVQADAARVTLLQAVD